MAEKALAIDIGGSKLLTAIAELERSNEPTRKATARLLGISKRALGKDSGKEGVWSALTSAVDETLAKVGDVWSEISSIGATIPGVADPSKGLWVYAPFSGISDYPIGDLLRERYGRPVRADNDVNACAWAEKVFGVCAEVDNFLWITISNGIGGGLVLNGRVFPGKFAGAAEIGHFNVEENGALCGCGNRGCLEATAAGPAIARTYRETLAALAEGRCDDSELVAQWSAYRTGLGKASQGSGKDRETEPTAATIAEEARLGNPVAISVYRKVGKCVGRAASWAANLVNPEKIVIGGGVAGAFDLFYPSLWNALQKGLFKSANKTLTVEKTGLGYEAGLMGATAVAAVPY